MNRLKTRFMIQKQNSMKEEDFLKHDPWNGLSKERGELTQLSGFMSRPPHCSPHLLPNIRWRNGDQEARSPTDSCESSFYILQTNFVLVSCNALSSGG